MIHTEFRSIPGYESYGVTKDGIIKSIPRDLILKQYDLNGYLIVDCFRDSLTETLPAHRAVALAWVPNDDPINKIVVNHKDGNPRNNWWKNLEWTTYSGNSYHAVNTGLRKDNIHCRVRNFENGNVESFSSIAQAAEFMGLRKDTPICMLLRKQFGALISDRFEFRFKNDQTPWFYESRASRIKPYRFMVEVRGPDGKLSEVYSNRKMLKDYQLYDSPYGRSIPGLVRYATEKYPGTTFTVRDSYSEGRTRITKTTKDSLAQWVRATKGTDTLDFSSLTRTAHHFDVSRISITRRLDTGIELDGWTFSKLLA